jgi:hypothetical protein
LRLRVSDLGVSSPKLTTLGIPFGGQPVKHRQFPYGYQEVVHVFYYDDVKNYSQVRTDQELLEIFNKHVDSKVVHMTIT